MVRVIGLTHLRSGAGETVEHEEAARQTGRAGGGVGVRVRVWVLVGVRVRVRVRV